MPTAPDIRVVTIEHGPLPGARSLNPRFGTGRSLLFASLDIAWSPVDPAAAIARLEESLLAFRPGFARHECRGAERYHVFAGARGAVPADYGSGARARDGFEPALALAHLLEHAVIDFQCSILRERRCSGVTAARRAPPGRFDLMVECGDPDVGRLCLALAIAWLTSALRGHTLGLPEREILLAARLAHDHRGQRLRSAPVARALRLPEPRAEIALAALREAGYLVETPYTMNLSGLPVYRVCRT